MITHKGRARAPIRPSPARHPRHSRGLCRPPAGKCLSKHLPKQPPSAKGGLNSYRPSPDDPLPVTGWAGFFMYGSMQRPGPARRAVKLFVSLLIAASSRTRRVIDFVGVFQPPRDTVRNLSQTRVSGVKRLSKDSESRIIDDYPMDYVFHG
jgi:hypothetical protein